MVGILKRMLELTIANLEHASMPGGGPLGDGA
jgi:hypothetical protein